MLRVASILCGLTLVSCGEEPARALLDWTRPAAPSPAPAEQVRALRLEGRTLRTDAGPVRLCGVNVCSLEFDASGANWELASGESALLKVLADATRWRVNVVRVPVNQQWFNEDDRYVERIEAIVDQANDLGVYVILDVQWAIGQKLEPYHDNILEVPTFGEGNTTEAFWLRATSRWANRTNLLYDLINEPHGREDGETAEAMQALVDALRSRDPRTPIVVGGMDWAHSVAYYAARPLRGANLIYAAHQYLPYDPPDQFDDRFGRAASSIPVLIGEFLADAENASYALALVDKAEATGAVGWLPWAIGCGFDKNADQTTEPLRSLAAKMREQNR